MRFGLMVSLVISMCAAWPVVGADEPLVVEVWPGTAPDEDGNMGESMTYQEGVTLLDAAPQACRFIIVKDGNEVHRAEGRNLNWHPKGPGKYRVEAELFVLDEWLPWIYTNPIELL